jgi:hypothetical protein
MTGSSWLGLLLYTLLNNNSHCCAYRQQHPGLDIEASPACPWGAIDTDAPCGAIVVDCASSTSGRFPTCNNSIALC